MAKSLSTFLKVDNDFFRKTKEWNLKEMGHRKDCSKIGIHIMKNGFINIFKFMQAWSES